MALVAYEFSDGSDAESEHDEKPTGNAKDILPSSASENSKASVTNLIDDEEVEIIQKASKFNFAPTEESESSDEEDEPVKVTFSSLPKPSFHAFSAYDSKIKNLKLTSLTKVIPVRSQGKKTEPLNGKKLNFSKETGLLSVLPQPENEKIAEATSVFKFSSKLIPTAAKTAITSKPKTETSKKLSSTKVNDEEEDIGSDFFSLSKDNTSEEPPVDIKIDLPDIKSDKHVEHFPKPHPLLSLFKNNDDANSLSVPEDTDNPQTLRDLDEDMLQKIYGRKRKGQIPDNIQIIDINEAEILAESKKVAEKHFTDEVMCNPAPAKCSSSTLSKRKHQITYLAFQAKERELELKNQWATNRATRKQTQSKYGF